MKECGNCGIGNLEDGVKVKWHNVGAHGRRAEHIYCDCESGQALKEDFSKYIKKQNK